MSQWKPRTKHELLRAIERGWQALRQQLSGLTDAQLTAAGPDGWSAKDHLVHLSAWESSMVALLSRQPRHTGLGVAEALYLSGDVDRVNAAVYARGQERPLASVMDELGTTHARLLGLLAGLGDDDLQQPYTHYLPDEPGADSGEPVLFRLAGNTYEHYADHLSAIRLALHLPVSLTAAEAVRQLRRTDALTGCGNLLGFLEWLSSQGGSVRLDCALLAVDLNFMAQLNATQGHERGDATLRWMSLVLQNETGAPVFRIGGDEFVVVLPPGEPETHVALTERVFERLNAEAGGVGVTPPAATLALVLYRSATEFSPVQIWAGLDAAVVEVKRNRDRTLGVFQGEALAPEDGRLYLLGSLIRHTVRLGANLDESQRLAFTDPVTDLPNLRAALQQLDAELARARGTGQSLALLMIDGDNLRRYNELGYAAGDRLIQDLGATLGSQLRPGDFLARWRSGDEFLVLLPDTALEAALAAGQRLCQEVRTASLSWRFPISISIGLVICPDHGRTPDKLIAAAETAKDHAKAQGKDRVVVGTF